MGGRYGEQRTGASGCPAWKLRLLAIAGAGVVLYAGWHFSTRTPKVLRPMREFDARGPVLALAVAPDLKMVAAGTAGVNEFIPKRTVNGDLTIWSEQDGKELHRHREKLWITSIAFVPNRSEVAYGTGGCYVSSETRKAMYGSHGELIVLRTTDFKEVRRIGLGSTAYCVRASPHGKYIAAASALSTRQNFLRVYDTISFDVILNEKFEGRVPFISPQEIEYRPASNIAFSPDGQWLAVGVDDPTPQIVIYDLELKQEVFREALPQKVPFKESINVVAFEPDGRAILILASPVLWRGVIDFERTTIQLEAAPRAIGAPIILPVGSERGLVSGPGRFGRSYGIETIGGFWDREHNRVASLAAPVAEYTLSFALSSDLTRAAAGDSDGKVHLWSLENLQSYFRSGQ